MEKDHFKKALCAWKQDNCPGRGHTTFNIIYLGFLYSHLLKGTVPSVDFMKPETFFGTYNSAHGQELIEHRPLLCVV
jgi:hypothetical protein